MTKKKYPAGTDRGSRCSGYGVYPDGRKCRGCSDCRVAKKRRTATKKAKTKPRKKAAKKKARK